jgi:hypothetical protein
MCVSGNANEDHFPLQDRVCDAISRIMLLGINANGKHYRLVAPLARQEAPRDARDSETHPKARGKFTASVSDNHGYSCDTRVDIAKIIVDNR